MTVPIIHIFEIWDDDDKICEIGCAENELSRVMQEEYPGREWERDDNRIDLAPVDPPAVIPRHETTPGTVEIDEQAMKAFAKVVRRIQRNRRKSQEDKATNLQIRMRDACTSMAVYERDLAHIKKLKVESAYDIASSVKAVGELESVSDVDANGDCLIVSLPNHKISVDLIYGGVSVSNGNGEVLLPPKIAKVIPKFVSGCKLEALVQLIERFLNGRSGQAEQN